MSYQSIYGKRPREMASKSMHSHIINDPSVKGFLNECILPPTTKDIKWDSNLLTKITSVPNPIKYIVVFDGGYTDTLVRPEFPSAKMAFFQFGALLFSLTDLEAISDKAFIDPADMQKLKQIERFKLAVPTKNITYKNSKTLTDSFRLALHVFFLEQRETSTFYTALKWLIFKEYSSKPAVSWNLSRCPLCGDRNIPVELNKLSQDFTFQCVKCNKALFFIDTLRLHEAIDDELGAGGVLGYLTVTLEQILMVYLVKIILETKPSLFESFLFVKDGPLAFFGQTANIHQPMRELIKHIWQKHPLYMAGIEKSGAFVEHAVQINEMLKPGHALILNNQYIYKNILPGSGHETEPYGKTTYYGNKIIYKSHKSDIFIVTLPTKDSSLNPKKGDFVGMDIIFDNLGKLKCHSYDSSLIPVALANKLVSLSNRPSATILGKFAKNQIE